MEVWRGCGRLGRRKKPSSKARNGKTDVAQLMLPLKASGPGPDVIPRTESSIITPSSGKVAAKDRFRAKVHLITAMERLVDKNSPVRWQADRSDPINVMREAVVIVMVGLPARGKSFISSTLIRFLRVMDVNARSFNAGKLRRNTGKAGVKADYFSGSNAEGKAERDRLAMECTDMMLRWIYSVSNDTTCVAILDATNTTRKRRQAVLERCRAAAEKASQVINSNPPPLRVVFLESVCDMPEILQANYNMKMGNEDYADARAQGGINPEESKADFIQRVHAYEDQYEHLDDAEVVYKEWRGDADPICGLVRIVNGGQKIQCCNLGCSMIMLNISMLLSCFHLTRRRVLLVPEADAEPAKLSKQLLEMEAKDGGRPVDFVCSASQHAVRIAQQVELRLNGVSRSVSGKNLHEESLRQPRRILSMRNMQPRLEEHHDTSADDMLAESFVNFVHRLKEVIFIVERLPRSLIILYPDEEVLRVLLAHFHGCPEDRRPWNMDLPAARIIQLERDHTGFAMQEVALPEASPSPEVSAAKGAS